MKLTIFFENSSFDYTCNDNSKAFFVYKTSPYQIVEFSFPGALPIVLDWDFYLALDNKTPLEIASLWIKNESVLKEIFRPSLFLSMADKKFQRLYFWDKILILARILSFCESWIHFKHPLQWLPSNALKSLCLNLFEKQILIEECSFCDLEGFTLITEKGVANQEEICKLDSLSLRQICSMVRGSLYAAQNGLSLKIDDLCFPIFAKDSTKLFGLVNQELLIWISDPSLKIERKEKPDTVKVPLISQRQAGGMWKFKIKIGSQIRELFSTFRSPTPFVFVKIHIDSLFFFSQETHKKVWPPHLVNLVGEEPKPDS